MTKATTEPIVIETTVIPMFRSTVFNVATACGNPSFVSEWRETYEKAEEDMLEHLVDVGTGFAGEVEKVYMTQRTWDAVLAPKTDETAA